jgi:hypothetical protein
MQENSQPEITSFSSPIPAPPKKMYNGLSGWLILVCLGMFLSVALNAYVVYTTVTSVSSPDIVDINANVTGYSAVLFFEGAMSLFFASAVICCIYLFFRKDYRFPKTYFYLLVATIMYAVADNFATQALSAADGYQAVVDSAKAAGSKGVTQSLVAFAIWGTYMRKSKRVKETFVVGQPVIDVSILPAPDVEVNYADKRYKTLAWIFLIFVIIQTTALTDTFSSMMSDIELYREVFDLLIGASSLYFIFRLFKKMANLRHFYYFVAVGSIGSITFNIILEEWWYLAVEALFFFYLSYYLNTEPTRKAHKVANHVILPAIILLSFIAAYYEEPKDEYSQTITGQDELSDASIGPSHFTAIGFRINSSNDVNQKIIQVQTNGLRTVVLEGEYWKLGLESGVELWSSLKTGMPESGLNPHYSGKSDVRVILRENLPNEDEDWLEGSFYSNLVGGADFTDGFPLVFFSPNFYTISDRNVGRAANVQIAAFGEGEEVEVFDTSVEYEEYQKDNNYFFAEEALIPTGTQDEDGNEVAPAQPTAIIAGKILEQRKIANEDTGKEFYWILAETLGGTYDIVVDPIYLSNKPIVGGIVFGSFWLSGIVK